MRNRYDSRGKIVLSEALQPTDKEMRQLLRQLQKSRYAIEALMEISKKPEQPTKVKEKAAKVPPSVVSAFKRAYLQVVVDGAGVASFEADGIVLSVSLVSNRNARSE